MITVKNLQLDNDVMTILNTLVDKDINAKAAFKLMRIIKELSSLVDDKIKMEKKIFEKWVEKDENGTPVPAKDEQGNLIENAVKITNVSSFNQEMSELMNIENIINYDKIKFEELGLDTAKVKDLIKIEFLFD